MMSIIRMGQVFRGHGDDYDDKPGKTRFLVSDDSMDRYSTRIRQDWDLSAFSANPVAPWSHDYSLPPLGRWADIRTEEIEAGRSGTLATLEWDMDDPESARIAGKYARGMMRAVSVGFRSGRQVPLRELEEGHPWRAESGSLLEQNELYEISPVTVPGNANAVAQGRQLSWVGLALAESAPADIRAEVIRLLSDDDEVRAAVREMCGDLLTVDHALHEARTVSALSFLFNSTTRKDV